MKSLSILLTTVLLLTLLGCTIGSRPERATTQAALFEGVVYSRFIYDEPRPIVLHLLEIDLSTPGVRLTVTPGQQSGVNEFAARTTEDFLTEFGTQLAINGSFFDPFYVNSPFDFYPRSGDLVTVRGLIIADGVIYSNPIASLPVLCVVANQAVIRYGDCPPMTAQAMVGFPRLVEQGQITAISASEPLLGLHPRTAVGVDGTGFRLWLVTVDGDQSGYSEGMYLAELAAVLLDVGAYDAFNLDGGGSSTLVMRQPDGSARLLNAPIHTGLSGRQRPVATHLGVYAPPLSPE